MPFFQPKEDTKVIWGHSCSLWRGDDKGGEMGSQTEEEEENAKKRNFFFKGYKVITTFISPRLCGQVGAHRTSSRKLGPSRTSTIDAATPP